MPEDYTSSMIPTWINCKADIGTYAHVRTIEMFLESVALSSMRAIDEQIGHFRASQDPVAMFDLSDMEDLRAVTLSALCLSLQSMWEQQFRSYLIACAGEIAKDQAGLAGKLQCRDWEYLKLQFFKLRKLPFSHFKVHRDLDLLNLLGNFCRHGEGRASAAIQANFPEFCTPIPASPPMPFDDSAGSPARLDIVLEVKDLKRFARAIVSFWTEAEWIYNNSISRKHENTVRAIKKREQELSAAAE
ncbi:hypothetical protein AB0V79_24370 [Mesorhizobium ciceri]|uniref:hypothetical protein n=1 Tax=Mesorhizobium TaxID=68287 RepID=UPI0007A94F4D|nr:hypothetical protein [Mesorhizobium ciceri]AMX98783.1 hypothetical protein A4R29_04075 [Mesorhizobium ciceri biovar biserrulae]